MMSHSRRAAAIPQMRPAPALVVRRRKRMPKTSPNNPPTNKPCINGVLKAMLCATPPASPVARPRAGSTCAHILGSESVFIASSASWATIRVSLLFQANGLDNVFREEDLDRPVHKYPNLAFQSRQL